MANGAVIITVTSHVTASEITGISTDSLTTCSATKKIFPPHISVLLWADSTCDCIFPNKELAMRKYFFTSWHHYDFGNVILEHIVLNDTSIFPWIFTQFFATWVTDSKSTLTPVMAWCRQLTAIIWFKISDTRKHVIVNAEMVYGSLRD